MKPVFDNCELLISVAMATCNGAEFLEQQIRSILDQTQVPNEIVIVDDASSDNSVEICARLLTLYSFPIKTTSGCPTRLLSL